MFVLVEMCACIFRYRLVNHCPFLNISILGRPTPIIIQNIFFVQKSEILQCKSGTKVNTEVNGQVLKNVGTYWNIRHHGYILELEQPRKTAKIPQIFSDFYYE